jgi:alginate O-acetyltransferase complex protein AlgI
MLFNSIGFAFFLPIVFILYWFAADRNLRNQNLLLLFSSYFFYACWDWRFMFLLIFSTFLDYFTGIRIYDASNRQRKLLWLWLSIGINLSFLGVFKYYNFFASSLCDALSLLGLKSNLGSIDILLPVGISFYTFHGLSYVIDIYKDRIKPERAFVAYSVFVSFFPLLVAGPIERATHLLPQILKPREFDYTRAVDGLRQILWGLFKKVVIADGCAVYANEIFNNSSAYSGSTLLLGGVFFSFQIYCDFSGYSDIALGTARLFGIELLRNFAFPYFSRDIAEFWRRWHISLSSWFKDYVYIPLGGSRGGTWMKVRNTFAIFLLSGFWHGANWSFILWGLLNAVYIMPSIISNTNRNHLEVVAKGRVFPNIKELSSIVSTYFLTVLAWIFFRALNVSHALNYLSAIFSTSLFTMPNFTGSKQSLYTLALVAIFVSVEWCGRDNKYALEEIALKWRRPSRWIVYFGISLLVFYFSGKEQQFIYFQF